MVETPCETFNLVDTVKVTVYPEFSVRVDTICINPDNPNEIVFVPVIEGPGDTCGYYDFEWVTSNIMGDTLVLTPPVGFTETLIISSPTIEPECWDTTMFEVPGEVFTISCPGDALYSCPMEVQYKNVNDVTVNSVCDDIPVIILDSMMTGSGCVDDTLIITRTYTADRDGNTAITGDQISCTQIIKVVDEDGPSISCPAQIEESCYLNIPLPYVDYIDFEMNGGDASDLCGLDTNSFELILVENSAASCPDTITRYYRIADNCGNYDTCFQYIIINDEMDPTIVAPRDTTADGCDSTMVLAITTLAYSETVVDITADFATLDGDPEAMDNC
jgi:hypothetical protein